MIDLFILLFVVYHHDNGTWVPQAEHQLSCKDLNFWFYAIGDEMYPKMEVKYFIHNLYDLIDIFFEYHFRCI